MWYLQMQVSRSKFHFNYTVIVEFFSLSRSVLQELSLQKGDICRPCWFVAEGRHPADTEERVGVFADRVGSQQ